MPKDEKEPVTAQSFEEQLQQERNHIDCAKQALNERLGMVQTEATKKHDDHLGLAFSGGGIRSATFNLGILQSLAKHRLLHDVDYLSTVSGGGYIGGWLSAWVNRSQDAQAGGDPCCGILEVEKALDNTGCRRDNDAVSPPPEEPPQVDWLRRFSNYLTPRLGVFGTDTLTALSTYLRNLLLNQLKLAVFGALLLLIPWIIASLLVHLQGTISGFETALYGLCAVLILAGTLMAGYETRDITDSRKGKVVRRYRLIVTCFALATIIGGSLIAVRAAVLPGRWLAIVAALAYAIGWFAGWTLQSASTPAGKTRTPFNPIPPVAGLFAGAAFGGLLYLWVRLDPLTAAQPNASLLLPSIVIGPLVTLGALLLTVTLHLGFAGRGLRETARELWSRHGADQLRIAFFWLLLTATALLGPFMVLWLKDWIATMGVIWILTTLAGVVTGAGSTTGGRGKSRWAELPARVAPYVFIVGMLMLLSYGVFHFLWSQWDGNPSKGNSPYETVCKTELPEMGSPAYDLDLKISDKSLSGQVYNAKTVNNCDLAEFNKLTDQMVNGRFTPLFSYVVILAFLLIVLSRRVDINVFSFHAFYRNRLERCYLGASHTRGRRPHPITGLDNEDSPKLHELVAKPVNTDTGKPYVQRPFPIINTALNLTSSKNLAWQERKAASFTFTPLFCGYELKGEAGEPPLSAYQQTGNYLAAKYGWLSLGLPITISGAAASPNSGYHTSAATAFLMTLFNVRLGWWLQNTRNKARWEQPGPKVGLTLLLQELAGMATDTSDYIYLSDGGHFENLGIYELVRRRCRYIIACDAGCDPHYGFEDLGNAIRKCKIDHGVDIEIDTRMILPDPASGYSRAHCAVGRIRYGGDADQQRDGYLLYIKASLTGDEATDILQYRKEHADFPHQTTADQWFSESQFESYRKLGAHILDRVIGDLLETKPEPTSIDLEGLFLTLVEHWYPSSRYVESAFSKHGEALAGIFEAIRKEEHLVFLDAQLYPEWWCLKQSAPCEHELPQPTMLPTSNEEIRAGFYLCNSLIQLMENVYLDLHLEEEYDHPDNRGWMNLFRHWSRAGMFRMTWAISASTYGARFQRFCHRHLSLHVGTLACCGEFPADDTARLTRLDIAERREVENLTGSRFMHELKHATVVQLSLRVDDLYGNVDKAALEFPVGFALIASDKDDNRLLIYYRIREHLRNIGLGYRGLIALKAEHRVCNTIRYSTKMPKHEEHRYRKLQRMWKTVERIHLKDQRRKWV
jgi:hypothetical protein